jgi:hypothetical protein
MSPDVVTVTLWSGPRANVALLGAQMRGRAQDANGKWIGLRFPDWRCRAPAAGLPAAGIR